MPSPKESRLHRAIPRSPTLKPACKEFESSAGAPSRFPCAALDFPGPRAANPGSPETSPFAGITPVKWQNRYLESENRLALGLHMHQAYHPAAGALRQQRSLPGGRRLLWGMGPYYDADDASQSPAGSPAGSPAACPPATSATTSAGKYACHHSVPQCRATTRPATSSWPCVLLLLLPSAECTRFLRMPPNHPFTHVQEDDKWRC